ncbi:hypothetical protein GWI33_004103 [Rhynchophorus ferrugineus]|uniref:Transposase n=1 Tax=Rhynchophorus ferrugineus TaxID=354439 RepID=A0A834MEX9_RHYFE|nr:hypothetical protein GWI33_004103 [Rhynchophorus ferrugineus]
MSTEDGERSGRPKELMIKRNKPEIFRRYVTMVETWLHHFTPNSNRESSEWTAHDEPAPKRGKTQQSAGKVTAYVFWDEHGILFIATLKRKDHQQRLLHSAIGPFEGRNRRKIAAFEEKGKVLLHQDNPPCQKSMN